MYVVTGATGQLGSRIVHSLLDRVPAERIGVSVRDAATAADLTARGSACARPTSSTPTRWPRLRGRRGVLVVSAAIRDAAQAAQAHRAAVDAARAAGAERVLYTSHQAASPASQFSPARGHAATEEHLAAGGPSLRCATGSTRRPSRTCSATRSRRGSSAPRRRSGLVDRARRPRGGGRAHAARREPRRGAHATPHRARGAGPRRRRRLLTDVSGRPVRRVVVDDEQWLADQAAAGVPVGASEFTSACSARPARGSSPSSTRPWPNSSASRDAAAGPPGGRRQCAVTDARSATAPTRARSAGTRYA